MQVKMRPIGLGSPLLFFEFVLVWVSSLPAAVADSDSSLAGESWGISIVALPFRLPRITSHSWLLPASTASLASKGFIVLPSLLTCLFLDRLLAALDSVPHLTAVVAFDLGPVLVIVKSLAKTPRTWMGKVTFGAVNSLDVWPKLQLV
jgi:hypothetical protein